MGVGEPESSMHKVDGLNIIHFDSVAEAASATPHNMFGSSISFFGHVSLEQAFAMCATGDVSKVAAAESLMTKFSAPIETVGMQDMPSVAGCYPCVPEALAGEPECMREPQPVSDASAPLTIWVDLTCSAGVSVDAICKRGVAILALTMALSASRPVTLRVFVALYGEKTARSGKDSFCIISTAINTAPLDLASAGYALTHPAFFRAVLFSTGYQYGFQGAWMKINGNVTTTSHEAYEPAVRAYLNMDENDLFLRGVRSDDEQIIAKPERWIADTLAKYSAQVD
jgi:hypothetical protein